MPADLAAYAPYLTRPLLVVQRDLESYSALLLKWNSAQNLVSRETTDLWARHVLDGVQLVKFVTDRDRVLCDIGSGGGLPAIPLAIGVKSALRRHVLIEPIGKKAVFLRQVKRQLQLDTAAIVATRVDAAPAISADLVTARAVTALTDLLGHVRTVMDPNGRALLHKGREHVDEITAARAKWQFDVIVHASDIDADGAILEVRNIRPL